jgi:hypothetical protein
MPYNPNKNGAANYKSWTQLTDQQIATINATEGIDKTSDPDSERFAQVVHVANVTDVSIQDNTSSLFTGEFSQALTGFFLAVDTVESTKEVLNFDFTAAPSHGIVIGNHIFLLDTAHDKSLFGEVTNVVGDVITLDRPIDHKYEVATTLGRIVTTEMSVVGSVASPEIFTMRAGTIPVDITSIQFQIITTGAIDDSKFGDGTPLGNGIALRYIDGENQTIASFKTNGDFRMLGADINITEKTGGGEYVMTVTWPIAKITGKVFRISNDEQLQLIVLDDTTAGTDNIKARAIGHQTTGEVLLV